MHLGKFVFTLDNIKQIALGGAHSCVLTNDGEVKCWGRNNLGQLGNNSKTDSLYPVDVHTSNTDSSILEWYCSNCFRGWAYLRSHHSWKCQMLGMGGQWGGWAIGKLLIKRLQLMCWQALLASELLSEISAISLLEEVTLVLSPVEETSSAGDLEMLGNWAMEQRLLAQSSPVDVHKELRR